MRHLKAGRKLGRNASHRRALMRNLAVALFRHERIITTVEKAKECRRFAERLITLAKRGTLHARRLVLSRLGPASQTVVKPGDDADADYRTVVAKLFSDIAPRYADRPGGYTRVIKRHERRLGDGGQTAFLELLKEGETRVRSKKPAPAPAPRITEPPAPAAPPPAPAESSAPPTSEGQSPEQTPPPAPENPPGS
jgi:large subunit ribosomal protein L17